MMKKRLFCALLAGLTVFSLAGCGNDSGSSTPASDGGAATTEDGGSTESVDTSIDFDIDPYEVHFMYLVAAEGSNQDKIDQLVNELTLENLNMTVDMLPMTFGAYNTTILG